MTFRVRRAGGSLLLPALFCWVPGAAHAQQWTVDLAAGRAVYDPVATHIGSTSASLGVRYDDGTRRWLYLSGGSDFGSQGLRWGAGGVGGRPQLRVGGASLGVNLSADLYAYSESGYDDPTLGVHVVDPGGTGVTLQALPSVVVQRGMVQAEAYAGGLRSMTGSSGVQESVNGFDGGARVAVTPRAGVQVGALARYLRFPEGGYPYLGTSASYAVGPGTVWAFGGRWLTELLDSPRTGYGIGGRVAVARGTEVQASWQQEASDPVYLNPARRTWSLRVSQAIGRAAPRALPAPVSIPVSGSGPVAIRIPASEASAPPSVLGDFTGWKPVAMARVGDFWEVRLPIAPGVHHYGFRRADGSFFIPGSLPKTDDGMGGESAVLVVS
ncbi:MAG: glycogen-binding domain-containing protein [Gemmatimonadetes bacterium]|nr:glycogen-binding domain-containing protein [Gemmatimonadota bacterium]